MRGNETSGLQVQHGHCLKSTCFWEMQANLSLQLPLKTGVGLIRQALRETSTPPLCFLCFCHENVFMNYLRNWQWHIWDSVAFSSFLFGQTVVLCGCAVPNRPHTSLNPWLFKVFCQKPKMIHQDSKSYQSLSSKRTC